MTFGPLGSTTAEQAELVGIKHLTLYGVLVRNPDRLPFAAVCPAESPYKAIESAIVQAYMCDRICAALEHVSIDVVFGSCRDDRTYLDSVEWIEDQVRLGATRFDPERFSGDLL